MKKYIYSFNKQWSLLMLPIWLCLMSVFLAFTNITWEHGALKSGWFVIRKSVWKLPDTFFIVMPIVLTITMIVAIFYRKEALLAFAPLPVIYGIMHEGADSIAKCTVYLAIPCAVFAVLYLLICLKVLPSAYICAAGAFICALYFPLSIIVSFVPLLESYNFYYGAAFQLSQTAVFSLMFISVGIFCLGLSRTVVEREKHEEIYDEVYDAVDSGDALKDQSHITSDDDIMK